VVASSKRLLLACTLANIWVETEQGRGGHFVGRRKEGGGEGKDGGWVGRTTGHD
jgi:hypothetical protein